MKKAVIVLPILLSIFLTACGEAPNVSPPASCPESLQITNAEQPVITVTSSEAVKVVPDIAEIVYGVRTEASDAKSCQEKNAESVNKVIDLLTSLGVEEKAIQTSDLSLNPRYDWSGNTQKLVGYEMNTNLTVSGLPLDQVGDILNQSVETGVNTIHSVTYKSSKYDENYQEALQLAIQTAKTKAEAMAQAGGCTLGGIVNLTESGGYQETRFANYNSDLLKAAADSAESVRMMAGEISVEAVVTINFSIQ